MGYLRFKIGDIITEYSNSPDSKLNYHVKWPTYNRFSVSCVSHCSIIGADWEELPKITENIGKYRS